MEFAFDDTEGREGRVYGVAEIIELVTQDLEDTYGEIWIQGEVGDVSFPKSGHVYFSLKDDSGQAVIQAVMFKPYYMKRRFDLASGRRVKVRGILTLYQARGAFQIKVFAFSDAGAGALAEKFEALKRKLMAEGLTAEERKRPVPGIPSVIGIVTSLEAAALQDMLRILRGRFRARIVISPAAVQGEEAPAQLVGALERLAGFPGLDVVIIGRGGGSAEDLMAFNDEALARAIAAFPVPVISAVGHEVDVTISDLVADLRAPTPTAAAQLVIPARDELEDRLHGLEVRLSRSVETALALGRNRLFRLRERITSPERMIMNRRQRIDELESDMTAAVRRTTAGSRLRLERLSVSLSHLHPGRRLAEQRGALSRQTERLSLLMKQEVRTLGERFGLACSRLEALSPLGVLSRGYAIATRSRDAAVIKSPDDVADGEALDLRLERGLLPCRAKKS